MHKYPIDAGLQISLDGITWYRLTDHNRAEIQANPESIEKSDTMADGTTRKYFIRSKTSISTSWSRVPSQTDRTVDGNYSSEWLSAFYKANVGIPMFVKMVNAKEDAPQTGFYPNESTRVASDLGEDIYTVFITDFSATTVWRTKDTDFVNMNIKFTEV